MPRHMIAALLAAMVHALISPAAASPHEHHHDHHHHAHPGDPICWSGDAALCDLASVAPAAGAAKQATAALPSCVQAGLNTALFRHGYEDGDGAAGVSGGAQLWSDATTWGGTVPQAGQSVLIPAGRLVVLDTNTAVLGSLTIEGTLVVAQDRDVTLSANVIMVHGGELRAGCADDRYTRSLTITLVGAPSSADPHGMGTKVLGAMAGGSIELHGRPVRSWTRLAASTAAGATQIRVVDASGWRVGDRIVVASSSSEPNQAEARGIVALAGDTLTLDAPLATPRLGVLRSIDGRQIDMRAEVGLLTRNIVVQGDPSSDASRFGGHIMIMDRARARIDGIQMTRLGQFDRLGRYPFHFHLLGDASGQYIRNSAVDGSFLRGIVVHGTRNTSVANNVVWDTIGHNYVIEDPTVIGNELSGNLGVKTRIAFMTDPVLRSQNDDQASNFWIKSARNRFIGNVAAGAEANGFWFDQTVDGPTDFRGNTAHSAAARADHVLFNRQAGLLVENGAETAQVPALEFVDTLLYRNGSGMWTAAEADTQPEVHRRTVFADHDAGFPMVAESVGGMIVFEDPLFVGDSGSPAPPGNGLPPVHLQYGASVDLRRPVFAHWGNRLLISANDIFAAWQADLSVSGARFVNTSTAAATIQDGTVLHALDDSYLPRGMYVDAFFPAMAGPAAVPVTIHGAPMLRFATPVGHAFIKLRVGNAEVSTSGVFIERNDGLRFRENASVGWRVAYGAGLSYRFESAPSTAAEYGLRLDLFGARQRAMMGPPQVPIIVPVTRAPLGLWRLAETAGGGLAPPGPGNALQPAASLAEFNASPLTRYYYDGAAQTVRFTADERCVLIRP